MIGILGIPSGFEDPIILFNKLLVFFVHRFEATCGRAKVPLVPCLPIQQIVSRRQNRMFERSFVESTIVL